jgi:hypothetical protein
MGAGGGGGGGGHGSDLASMTPRQRKMYELKQRMNKARKQNGR